MRVCMYIYIYIHTATNNIYIYIYIEGHSSSSLGRSTTRPHAGTARRPQDTLGTTAVPPLVRDLLLDGDPDQLALDGLPGWIL